jgi:molecular chaperone GrpE
MSEEQTKNGSAKTAEGEAELEKCKKLAEEYLNNWKKERADFINYRKEEMKRLEELIKFANEEVILEVIDVLDDLDIALKHGETANRGLDQIAKKFADWLKKYGVERIKIDGEKFNPELHEAVDGEEGEKIEEIRAGYKMHGKIIRPARVKLIK